MITLKVDPDNPDMAAIRAAADAIRRGELVIFPTETVYGLAADAMNESAVKKVFDAKGRLDHEALPVQVGSMAAVSQAAEFVPENARLLAERFWPGPLTLVLPKSAALSSIVTGGRNTVGVRVSDHPVALALAREVGSPIVATSANVSGAAAPRNAEQAIRGIGESASIVLNGGECRLGVSSTVVDVSVTPARILRRGTIGVDEIRKVLGEVEE
jgi:L-threonylcarbamoyladenylate synthase